MGCCINLTHKGPLVSSLQIAQSQATLLPTSTVASSLGVLQKSFLTCSFPHISLPLSLINPQWLCPRTHGFPMPSLLRPSPWCAGLGPYPTTPNPGLSKVPQAWSTSTPGQGTAWPLLLPPLRCLGAGTRGNPQAHSACLDMSPQVPAHADAIPLVLYMPTFPGPHELP